MMLAIIVLFGLVVMGDSRQGITEDGEYHSTYGNLREIPRDIPGEALRVFLAWNEISYVRAGAFSHQGECVELDLHKNLITKIRPDMFEGLSSLEQLDLSYNEISLISPGTFAALARLHTLSLSGNMLASLRFNMFDSMNHPNPTGHPVQLDLALDQNPLRCNKRMCWLKEAEAEGWIRLQYEYQWVPTCVNYKGIPWKSINLKCD